MRRVKVEDSDGHRRVGDDLDTYPDRPGEPDCIYFLRTGSCGFGNNCRYNHPSTGAQVYDSINTSELPERPGQPDCGYYVKTGTCKYGSACKYHHPKDKPSEVMMNAWGLPMREDVKPCPYYMRTGVCKYGSVCKFNHPQPALTSNSLPVAGTSPSTPPSLQMPTYFAASPGYMPLYVSPSQGWNTYMANVSPLSGSSVLTTSSATNGRMPVSYLPERPDQPECRYFMKYGSCKYRSECKYHHPREKVLASSTIGPLELPLGPGQLVCSYCSFYGLYDYGLTCKFNHSSDGYSCAYTASYGLSMPLFSPPYSVPVPFQKMPVSDSKSSWLDAWAKKGSTTSNYNDKKNEDANA